MKRVTCCLVLLAIAIPGCDPLFGSVGETAEGGESDSDTDEGADSGNVDRRLYEVDSLDFRDVEPLWMDCFDADDGFTRLLRSPIGDVYAVVHDETLKVRRYRVTGDLVGEATLDGDALPSPFEAGLNGSDWKFAEHDGRLLLMAQGEAKLVLAWFDTTTSALISKEYPSLGYGAGAFLDEVIVDPAQPGSGWIAGAEAPLRRFDASADVVVVDPERSLAFPYRPGVDRSRGAAWIGSDGVLLRLTDGDGGLPIAAYDARLAELRYFDADFRNDRSHLDADGFLILDQPDDDIDGATKQYAARRYDFDGQPRWVTTIRSLKVDALFRDPAGEQVLSVATCQRWSDDADAEACDGRAAALRLDADGELVDAIGQDPALDFAVGGFSDRSFTPRGVVFSGRNTAGQACVAAFPI